MFKNPILIKVKLNEINAPVSSLTGLGPALTKILAKINIFTVGDLLKYYPRDYEDRTKRVSLSQFEINPKIHTVAYVLRHEWFGYGNMKTLKIIINDGTLNAELICFRRAFLENSLPVGSFISLHGTFGIKYNCLQSSTFEATKIQLPDLIDKVTGQVDFSALAKINPPDNHIFPVYPLTEGLTQKVLIKAINNAIKQYTFGLEDEIPQNLLEERKLLHKIDAIKKIHNPQSMDEAEEARKTLAYEELYLFQKTVIDRAYKHKGTLPELENAVSDITSKLQARVSPEVFEESLSPLQKQFLHQLPYKLTPDQMTVIYQMDSDIDKGYEERARLQNQAERGIPMPKKIPFSMARLLQGDVGCGKTLVSLFICLRIISWKGQCAFMAPTELLASQHAETTARLLDFLGIRVAFLTGNVKAAGRNQILKALKEGQIDIIIGTHALFSANTIYKDLQLAVIDEQHRFGVLQRQAILEKGRKIINGVSFEPHLLMMSATPIPQSLALTVFGDLDLSTIKTMPEGRKEITTYLVREGNEIKAYEEVRKELQKGRQAYFVYPAINSDNPTVQLKSAQLAFDKLSKHIFPQYKCALVHSKIPEEEQESIFRDFRDGKINILAATTVIEVGIDVPNATCMVIEQADRFGMAQLHQLRGRVGRGKEQSYCFLIYSQNLTKTGIERMKVLRQSTDGFYIAEQDLKTRGPGEITGTLQAGQLEFNIADLSKDQELLYQARQDALQTYISR